MPSKVTQGRDLRARYLFFLLSKSELFDDSLVGDNFFFNRINELIAIQRKGLYAHLGEEPL